MPVYEYTCSACNSSAELLRALGDTEPPACAQCSAQMQRKFSRVAVKYGAWGFTSTDSLVGDSRGKDFKALRNKAEEISDS